jgi:hypothetical protein
MPADRYVAARRLGGLCAFGAFALMLIPALLNHCGGTAVGAVPCTSGQLSFQGAAKEAGFVMYAVWAVAFFRDPARKSGLGERAPTLLVLAVVFLVLFGFYIGGF